MEHIASAFVYLSIGDRYQHFIVRVLPQVNKGEYQFIVWAFGELAPFILDGDEHVTERMIEYTRENGVTHPVRRGEAA